jgi:hypothetical protein
MMRAISIRQPYVEQILRGIKKRIPVTTDADSGARVPLREPPPPSELAYEWREVQKKPGDLPVGIVAGSVEVLDRHRIAPRVLHGLNSG